MEICPKCNGTGDDTVYEGIKPLYDMPCSRCQGSGLVPVVVETICDKCINSECKANHLQYMGCIISCEDYISPINILIEDGYAD